MHVSSYALEGKLEWYRNEKESTHFHSLYIFVRHNGLQGNNANALDSFLKTSSEATFDFLEAALTSPHTSSEMTAELWKAVESMVPQLVKADNTAFARLVLTHFPEKHDGLINSQKGFSDIQYRYVIFLAGLLTILTIYCRVQDSRCGCTQQTFLTSRFFWT